MIHLQIKDLPSPSFMKQTLKELGIGTYDNIVTVSMIIVDVFVGRTDDLC